MIDKHVYINIFRVDSFKIEICMVEKRRNYSLKIRDVYNYIQSWLKCRTTTIIIQFSFVLPQTDVFVKPFQASSRSALCLHSVVW